eukprot:6195616-Pleurochrysis_carterae.AAC.1
MTVCLRPLCVRSPSVRCSRRASSTSTLPLGAVPAAADRSTSAGPLARCQRKRTYTLAALDALCAGGVALAPLGSHRPRVGPSKTVAVENRRIPACMRQKAAVYLPVSDRLQCSADPRSKRRGLFTAKKEGDVTTWRIHATTVSTGPRSRVSSCLTSGRRSTSLWTSASS